LKLQAADEKTILSISRMIHKLILIRAIREKKRLVARENNKVIKCSYSRYRRIEIKKGSEKVWSPRIYTEKKQIYLYINIVIKI